MDIISLYYFIEAGKTLNFTKAAQKLFISQQNLSKHIKNLEEYYQVQLFERKPHLKLTDAGKVLMEFAETMFAQERNVKNVLNDISNQRRGTLRIGASAPRSRIFMPEIINLFAAEYPLVQIELINSTSSELEKMAANGEIDFAVGIFSEPSPQLIRCNLLHDHIYFVASDSLLYRCLGERAIALKDKQFRGIQMSDTVGIPLIFPSSSNRLTHTLLQALQKTKPLTISDLNIYMYTTYPQFYLDICIGGLAAAFLTQMSLFHDIHEMGPQMNFFPLYDETTPLYHSISLLYQGDQKNQPKFKCLFLHLIKAYFSRIEQQRLLERT